MTPTGLSPSKPPQLTAFTPPSTSAAPTSPPTSACPELDGSPRDHVKKFHTTAPVRPAPTTAITSDGATVTMPAIVSATAAPSKRGPRTFPIVASTIACAGRAAARGDERGDGVGGVVETVRQCVRQRHEHRDHCHGRSF